MPGNSYQFYVDDLWSAYLIFLKYFSLLLQSLRFILMLPELLIKNVTTRCLDKNNKGLQRRGRRVTDVTECEYIQNIILYIIFMKLSKLKKNNLVGGVI